MDETDARILREMLREKVFFWSALDPSVSADDVARKLRIARSTVHARVSAWRKSGFLAARAFLPHPGLFGVGLGGGALRVTGVREKAEALDALALVPGVFSALDHVGEWVTVCFVWESQASLDRRLELVRRLPGVAEMTPCAPIRLAPCERAMTRLDWRIIESLRRGPDRSLSQLAHEVHVSPKTYSRHYRELLDAHTVWFVPIMDFTRAEGTIVRFILTLDEHADRNAVVGALDDVPHVLDVTDAKRLIAKATNIDLLLWARNAASAEDAQRRVLEVKGVHDVEPTFPRKWTFHDAWANEQIARITGSAT